MYVVRLLNVLLASTTRIRTYYYLKICTLPLPYADLVDSWGCIPIVTGFQAVALLETFTMQDGILRA